MDRWLRFCFALLFVFTNACSEPPSAEAPAEAGSDSQVDLDLESRDLKVVPGDDFFDYANGGWSAVTEIPADRASTGSFLHVFERTEGRLAELVEGTLDAPSGSAERKIGDFYSAYLDEEAIDARGLTPLESARQVIDSIVDLAGLSGYLGTTLRNDVDAFNATDLYTENLLGLWVSQDIDEPTRYVPFVLQGGLDMPDRAYYLGESEAMEEARAACLHHMTRVLELAGAGEAGGRAAAVFELERQIALVHWSREESGDLADGNNPWSQESFASSAPGLDWPVFFAAAGLDEQTDFVVWQPSAVSGISSLVASQPLDVWRDYSDVPPPGPLL